MNPPASNDPIIGMTIGGCRIEGLLGRGGMGTVYRAHHLALDKTVAVKILAAHLEADPRFVDRFVSEARAAAKIEHPNVVQVLNVAEENGQHFIIMQFIDGPSLEQVLAKSKKLEASRAMQVARDIAAGLEALHGQGIIHRDIKPANILIGKDEGIRITDFGLARNLHVKAGQTISGTFMGTPEYVAPEQVNGPAVDHRADLYSLGVTLYFMLSGELPFEAVSAVDMAVQQVTAEPKPLEERVPGLDKRLLEIVRKLLRKDPKERFQDAGELAAAFEAIQNGPRVSAPEVPEVAVKGRIAAPAPVAPPAKEENAVVPEISAGPRKRALEGGPVIPREIVPPPPAPPRRVAVEPPEPPPPPAPKPEPVIPKDLPPSTPRYATPVARDLPPSTPRSSMPVVSPQTPARASMKPARRPSAQPLGKLAFFWLLILAGSSLFFSAAALGATFRGDRFWEGLLEPIVHDDSGRLFRWGLLTAGAIAFTLALLSSRSLIRDSLQPGGAVMLPIFSALCFYAAGLIAPPDVASGPLPLRAFHGAVRSMLHPSVLAPLAAWGLLAGMTTGASGGATALLRLWGALLVLGSVAACFAFGAGGHARSAFLHAKEDPAKIALGGGALALTILGLALLFGARLKRWRRVIGTLAVLAGAALAVAAGGTPSFAGFTRDFETHGGPLILGAFLLYWGGWSLHRK